MSALAIFAPRRFGRLLAADALNISRDPMLLLATLMSVAPSVAFVLGREAMDNAALSAFGLVEFSRYVAPLVLIMPAVLIGWVTGFLLLEDRDDGVLMAVDVTPVGKTGFLGYRGAVTALVAAAITATAVRFVAPDLPLPDAILLVLIVAADAVLAAAILPAIARNKVEGLALTKLTNISVVVPLLAIIPSPFRYVAGIVPTYWIGELLALSGAAALPFPAIAALALAAHAIAAVLLLKLLKQRAG